jgi:hypothetical protein
MLLSEIKDTDALITHVLRKLMRTNTVSMWFNRDGVNQQVDIVDVEDEGDGWVKVHFGVPNIRTGDIDDNGWHTEDFETDKVTVTKNDKGEWWLHEID